MILQKLCITLHQTVHTGCTQIMQYHMCMIASLVSHMFWCSDLTSRSPWILWCYNIETTLDGEYGLFSEDDWVGKTPLVVACDFELSTLSPLLLGPVTHDVKHHPLFPPLSRYLTILPCFVLFSFLVSSSLIISLPSRWVPVASRFGVIANAIMRNTIVWTASLKVWVSNWSGWYLLIPRSIVGGSRAGVWPPTNGMISTNPSYLSILTPRSR